MGQPGAGWSEQAIWEKQTSGGVDSAWSHIPPHRAAFVFLIQSPAAVKAPGDKGWSQALLRPGSRALLSALQGEVSAGEVLGRRKGGDKRYPQAEDAAENWMGSQERQQVHWTEPHH